MVTCITGPMFSFKSSELFRHIERSLFAKKKVILVRPSADSREYFSHSPAVDVSYNNYKIHTVRVGSFDELVRMEDLVKYDVIFMDEAFMVKDAYRVAKDFGHRLDVFYAGLLASSENKTFEEVTKYLPYCDVIQKLNGVCMDCGDSQGNFSYFVGNKKSGDIHVGDSEYICVCAKCLARRNLAKDFGILTYPPKGKDDSSARVSITKQTSAEIESPAWEDQECAPSMSVWEVVVDDPRTIDRTQNTDKVTVQVIRKTSPINPIGFYTVAVRTEKVLATYTFDEWDAVGKETWKDSLGRVTDLSKVL